MTKIAAKTTANAVPEAPAIILFGIDETGKPRAAQFGSGDPELVAKAAELMKLTLCTAASSNLAEIASKLPVGRIHATGRAFVPNVRRDLYAKLLEAVAATEPTAQATGAAEAYNGSSNGKPKPAASPGQPKETQGSQQPAEAPPPVVAHGLPRSWTEISIGHLVIAQEGRDEGWWEAIVTERDGDTLTLRWRDYPRQPKVQRPVLAVALLHPVAN